MLKAGDKAPDFLLPSTDDVKVGLEQFKGSILVLYFFPKADTPG
jgi:thioredoxin-dependent peroxiredoxin